MIVRILVSLVLVAVIVASFWLLAAILRFVRAIPSELKRDLVRQQDQNAEQHLRIRQLEGEHREIVKSNSRLAAWKEGRRGWESEREDCLKKISELEKSLAQAGTQSLSLQEDREVHFFRDVWEPHGQAASDKLCYLFINVMEEVGQRLDYTEILPGKIAAVERTAKQLTEALDKPSCRLAEAIKLFNAFYHAYVECLKWLAKVERSIPTFHLPEHAPRFARWLDSNHRFVANVRSLEKRPTLQGVLGTLVGDEGAAALVNAKPAVMPSTSHTGALPSTGAAS